MRVGQLGGFIDVKYFESQVYIIHRGLTKVLPKYLLELGDDLWKAMLVTH